ncbi:hypothetical protein TRFO_34867 [Tritrichomonas foetus]|uniref:N-acetylgalactosaminide beta-1,3-galactosyltransferase n=1 Tax=Tritrichomonas foetus TaxID=1144522 RepID=A0A1J4JJB0_9EUKA|nr:hypothetical protein TRFO_34867 [Tritrichomonas foetus]|eukprot:OHS98681.1 hypothetical protein TRFO_34867 [Tritrichomonas foetus]
MPLTYQKVCSNNNHQVKVEEMTNRKYPTSIFSIYSLSLAITFLIFHFLYFQSLPEFSAIRTEAIYLASIVNSPNYFRTRNLYEKWGKKFIQKNPDSIFKFVSNTLKPEFQNMTIFVPSRVSSYRIFFQYFVSAVEDFLNNTKLNWIYRTTEDCLVDVDQLDRYMEYLTTNFSPDDIVIRGHAVQFCQAKNINCMFIHGGSGWIMSREACKCFMKNIDKLWEYHNSIPNLGDDVVLGYFAKLANLSFNDIDDHHFLGSPYNDFEIEVVTNRTWHVLPSCVAERETMLPIRKIVFWHSGRIDNYPISIGVDAKKVYPNNIYYEQLAPKRQLCEYRNDPLPK